MEATATNKRRFSVRPGLGLVILIVVMCALPFLIAVLDGQSIASLVANKPGQSKFIQGLLIEVFILAIFALSYDLIFGITGMLSLGHAMFYAVAPPPDRSCQVVRLNLPQPWGLLVVASIVQACCSASSCPGQGRHFCPGHAGVRRVFHHHPDPRSVSTAPTSGCQASRSAFQPGRRAAALLFHRAGHPRAGLSAVPPVCRFTGRVYIATRENRRLMLGYNTFTLLAALIMSSFLPPWRAPCTPSASRTSPPRHRQHRRHRQCLADGLIGGIGTSAAPIGEPSCAC